MQTISRITVQKKNKHRFNIFLKQDGNESYAFSVEEDTLINEHLHKGMELEQTTIDSLIKKDNLHKGYSLALHFLSYRMRSVKEMHTNLVKKELDEEQINVIIDRLLKDKWLDDQQFAQAFVQTKIQTTTKGPQLIKKELIEKGVVASMADTELENYSFDEQVEKVRKLIIKKQQQSNKASFKQQFNKTKQHLMQKGFSQDVITAAFDEVTYDKDDDQEWEAVVYQGEKILQRHQRKWTGFELEQKVKASLYQKGFSFDEIGRFVETYVKDAE